MTASDSPYRGDRQKAPADDRPAYRTVLPNGITLVSRYRPVFIPATYLRADGADDRDVREAVDALDDQDGDDLPDDHGGHR